MQLDYTGNIRYRKNIFGMLVVEVEYKYLYSESAFNQNDAEELTAWKVATGEDLYNIKSEVPLV